MTRAAITGVGHWLPPDGMTSLEVEERVNRESAPFSIPRGLVKLVSGVRHRYYAAPPLNSAELATNGCLEALRDAGRGSGDVDLLIFASASTALLEPATANLVQERLGCTNARVFDVKNACSSFVDALDVGRCLIETGRHGCGLIAVGEVISPTIRWMIRNRGDLARGLAGLTLGDAGAACVIEPSAASEDGLHSGVFMSDGKHWRLSAVRSGGTLLRHDMSHLYLDCDSVSLQRVGREIVPGVISAALQQVDWTPDDLSLVAPHQVSDAAIDGICELAGIDARLCTRTLRDHGNTGAASIPLGLSLARQEGRLFSGARVLLVGVSAGFSAAAVPVVWS